MTGGFDATKSEITSASCNLMIAAGVTIWLVLFPPWTSLHPSPDDPVQSVNTQRDALRIAKASDIPAVSKADRMVIKIMRGPEETGQDPPFPEGQSLTISDQATIQAIVDALVVKETPETGNTNFATVTFYKGEKEIRSIWLFGNGEWGFNRPTPG